MSICPTLECPCGRVALESAFEYESPPSEETRFDLRGQTYRRGYDRCTICSHWFGRHELDLRRLYAHDYAQGTYGGPDGMRRRFEKIMALPTEQSDNRQRVARVLAFASTLRLDGEGRPRLLDVGAGLGVFPAAMRAAGWRVAALEPDARTVEHLREVAGVDAENLSLLDCDRATFGPFEAITLNKVLEHVEDPLILLRAAGPFLTKPGFVYVEVPDVAAAAAGPGREEFFIEHHHVFSPASLAMLAERAGLAVAGIERLREPSGKFTLRAFLVRPTL